MMDHPSRGLSRFVNGNGHDSRRLSVLAVGAHPDDIELGCAATLLAHRARGDAVAMLVMSRGELGPQDERPRLTEQEAAAEVLGAELYWGDFRDSAIPDGCDAVDVIQDVMARVCPDVVYTHFSQDSHQDHRAVAATTLAAARRSTRVVCYEAPSSLAFAPTMFVDVANFLEGKLEALRAHTSQVLKNGLVDLEAIEAQARYRGFQARIRFAEAFVVERFLWDLARTATVLSSANHADEELMVVGR
jgi:LmbE family N-acetylglucosaminyl deacetylase